MNKTLKENISSSNRECNVLTNQLQSQRDYAAKEIRDLETKLFSEKHTKEVLVVERDRMKKELLEVQGKVAIQDRKIKHLKNFGSKRDEEHKKMDDEKTLMEEERDKIDKITLKLAKKLRKKELELIDPRITKNAVNQHMLLKSEHN